MSEEKSLRQCVFRPHTGIYCDEEGRKCLKCGWNYDVEEARKIKLYEEALKKKCLLKT